MIPVLIVELDTHDNEYHPAGAASLGKDIVDMGPAGNGLAGSYRLETLDGFACIHADAEPGKVLGQHSPAGKTGPTWSPIYPGRISPRAKGAYR